MLISTHMIMINELTKIITLLQTYVVIITLKILIITIIMIEIIFNNSS